MLKRLFLCCLVAALAVPASAAAHVTLNPGEWEAGGFARFTIRVPNERPDAETTEVTVEFPESVISARFQPHPLCERSVERAALDEPVDDVTERIVSVTWTCPGIAPDEFEEFGISFRVPDTPGEELAFPALQTYSSGEVVRWIGPADADEPAPRVAVLASAEEEEPAEEEEAAEEEPAEEEGGTGEQAAASAADDGDSSGRTTLALVLGAAGLVAGLAALALTLARRPRPM